MIMGMLWFFIFLPILREVPSNTMEHFLKKRLCKRLLSRKHDKKR